MSRLAILTIAIGLLSVASGCCSSCGGCNRPLTSYNYNPAYPTAYAPQYSTAYAPAAGCSSCAAGVAPF